MSQGNLRWNDIEVTWEDRDVDFYVIINAPWPGEHYVPARTVVFQMEPWCAEPWQTWGVKTWGDWATPDPSHFLQVRAHRTHLNNAFWQLDATYQELRAQPVVKTGLLSSICSGKYFDPGHIKRVDFLKFLEQKDDDVVRVDLYARDNPLGFTSWKGPVPGDVKDAAIAPYRYFFAAENNREHNFITEKLWEPLVTETLCFYWGCPNASEWIDPRAFIALDLDNFEHAFHTMKDAILANEWDKRVDVIRGEKAKVLDQYQFFPTLARVLHDELRLPPHPDDATVRYHKYFADALDATMDAVCFIHSYTRNGDTAILTEILANVEASGLLAGLSRLYVVNCGNPLTLPPALSAHAERLRVIEFSPDASRGEGPTLDLVRTFAMFHPDAHILYLHTKGASHAQHAASVADWRRLMLHYLVDRHIDARAALEANDAVGCNLMELPHRHFSGNFWWANAAYLRTLPSVPAGERHEAEWWMLGGDDVRATSLHDSGVDHYQQRYSPSQYEKSLGVARRSEEDAAAGPSGAEAGAGRRVPPSICLVMIVRNEAHIVHEALASTLPHVADCVVVDTGSTDGTPETIRRFCAAQGLPARVFERPWRDFGSNRTEALALARDHSVSDYLWMFDADDLLEGTPNFAQLTADACHVRLGPDIEYWRLQIFRRVLPWRYVGVLHEYPACDRADARLEYLQGDYRILSRRLGQRSLDPQKYAQDAALLEEALGTDPDNTRYAFYLGQSRYDAGQFEAALEAYQRRAAMGGWSEEVFYARYRAALCLERLGRPYAEVIEACEACFRDHPHRCEPLVRAATLARHGDHFRDAYVFARRAASVPMPGAEGLFVETADYAYRARDEQSIAAFYCGFPAESFDLCSELLDGCAIPEGERPRIEQNRDYSVPAARQALAHYDANLVAGLASRPAAPQPNVTLAITSCRRLDLFISTVSSFLNACADLHLVGRFICIDDNSSAADRETMQRQFPFFEFIFKGPEDRGHARSLNILRDTVRSPWLLHLEDDWQFFARRPYIGQALEILDEDPALGQVLFNRNYAETLDERNIPGGFLRRTQRHGYRYRVHEHYPVDTEGYRQFELSHGEPSNAWWPHYSLRPSLLRTSVFQSVGAFDESAGHFEHDYARRYLQAGFRSAFFDGIYALHTGRLTSERGDPAKTNAYELNGQPQFGAVPAAHAPLAAESLIVKVINLARRHERLDGFRARVADAGDEGFLARVERFEAIDGRELELIPEIRHLFRDNDFGYRRSVVGCALSHLALWSDLAARGAPGMLVFEDDATLCPGFNQRLEEICAALDQQAPGFDVAFLGITDWQPRPEDDFDENRGVVGVRRFEGSHYLGGTFAYIVSRRGAQRLLALVERDGIQNGIDRFVHRKESELSLWVAAPHLVRAPLVPPGSGLDSDVQNDFEPLPQPC